MNVDVESVKKLGCLTVGSFQALGFHIGMNCKSFPLMQRKERVFLLRSQLPIYNIEHQQRK